MLERHQHPPVPQGEQEAPIADAAVVLCTEHVGMPRARETREQRRRERAQRDGAGAAPRAAVALAPRPLAPRVGARRIRER
jgi:hypothetical protein